MAEYCRNEQDGELIRFENHDYMELLIDKNGCRAGCRTGLLYYRQTEYIQGGVHDDQEGFFVLEGNGWAKMGEREFPIAPGSSFIAPAGMWHYIRRNQNCPYVKLFFFHAYARESERS